MSVGRLPVLSAVWVAYHDAGRVLRTMPGSAFIVLLVMFAGAIVELRVSLFMLDLTLRSPSSVAAMLRIHDGLIIVIHLVQAFLLTPFLIAIARFIILDEVARRYALEPRNPRFRRSYMWLLALGLCETAASALAEPWLPPGVYLLVIFPLAVIVGLPFIILIPAIAVDAPGATVSNGFADIKGHALDVLLVFVVAATPLAVVELLASSLRGLRHGGIVWLSETLVIAEVALLQSMFMILFAAIASRVFQALAHRVAGRRAIDGAAPT